MTTKRLTNHNGRKGKDGVYSAKHNDRNYDVSHSKHVDSRRSVNNRIWHYYPDENLTFEEAEQKYYENTFTNYLQAKNERYIRGHHKERVQSMEDYRKNARTCPEETIMQIGNVDNGSVSPDELWKLCQEQIEWESNTFPNVVVLDVALHVDEEGSPHIHERKVWVSDDDGIFQVNQNKALEAMGIERPDMSKKKDRYNNPKMTYSQLVREHFIELCRAHGIEIEEIPKEASETGLTLTEYKHRREKEKLEQTEQKLSEVTEELGRAIEEKDRAIEEKNIYKQDAEAKIEQLSDIVDNYLNVNRKRKLLKEDTFEMSQAEHERFEADKLEMAKNAQIILDAENINKKREEVLAVRKEYQKYKGLKESAETEYSLISAELPMLRAERDEIQSYVNKNIPEKIKAMEQNSRLSLLESIVADAGKALKSLDRFLDEHTNIQYHSKIREMVRAVSSILNKASRKKPETTRDRGLEH